MNGKVITIVMKCIMFYMLEVNTKTIILFIKLF